MNRRLLQAVIILLWVFLGMFAVLKLFFNDWFLAVADNDKVALIGEYIDHHWMVKLFADTLLGVIGMQFYLCACKQVWRLQYSHYVWLTLYTLALNFCYLYNSQIASIIDLLGFVLIPMVLKCNLKQTVIVFILHQVGQILILFIRNEPLYLDTTNYATRFLLLFDAYVWLVLYYIYSNLYKEKTLWEWLGSPFSAMRRMRKLQKNSKE